LAFNGLLFFVPIEVSISTCDSVDGELSLPPNQATEVPPITNISIIRSQKQIAKRNFLSKIRMKRKKGAQVICMNHEKLHITSSNSLLYGKQGSHILVSILSFRYSIFSVNIFHPCFHEKEMPSST
jgi:hypothetical protein